MLQIRKAKKNKLTTQIVFESGTIDQLKSNIALGLLTGGFNPLRKYAKNGQPISLDKLKDFQLKFNNLISEVKNEMNININEVENF